MSNVYRQKSTGDLYVIDGGELGRMVDLQGQRQLTICHPHRVVDAEGKMLARPYGNYEPMNELHALWLVVSKDQFDAEFEKVAGLRHVHNEPIEALVQHYEEERCDFSDEEFLVNASLRYAHSMEDCQVRCLLYSLAMNLQAKREAVGLTSAD